MLIRVDPALLINTAITAYYEGINYDTERILS